MDKMKNASKRPNEVVKNKKHTDEYSEAKENDSKHELPTEESSSKSEVPEFKIEMDKEDSPDSKSTAKTSSVPSESGTKEEKNEAGKEKKEKKEEKGEKGHEGESKEEKKAEKGGKPHEAAVNPLEEQKESEHEIPEELKEKTKETSAEVHTKDAKTDEIAKEIEFSIEYFTNFGEKLVVVGSAPELGAWDEKAGLALEWNEPNIWKAKAKIENFPVEYKYLVISENTCNWENGQNRILTAESELVKDCWQLE